MQATGAYEPVLIDLDLVGPQPRSHGPRGTWRRRWLRSRRLIGVVVAAVLAAALAALSADRSGDPDTQVTMSTDATPLAILGDTVYASPASGDPLSAYSLRTGRPRWTAEVPAVAHAVLFPVGPDVVLTSWDQSRTVAVDRRTGAVRWQRTGSVAWWSDAGDRIALVTQDPADDGPNQNRFAVTVVSTASGAATAELSRTGPISLVFAATPGGSRTTGVFVRDDSAGGRLFDYATGQTRRLSLPQPPAPGDPDPTFAGDRPQYETVLLAGDYVLVSSAWSDRIELTGYGGDPLRPRWTVPDLTVLQAWQCGTALCGSSGTRSFALDPVRGELSWQGDLGALWPVPGGRALSASPASGSGTPGVAVLDQVNGRDLLGHNTWRLISNNVEDQARVPVMVESRDQILASLDVTSLTTRRIAVLPGPNTRCWSGDRYVVCQLNTHTLRAWRYTS